MTKIHKLLWIVALAGAISIMTGPAFSAPIVSYDVSGSPGNWILDFNVTNTLGVNNLDIYFFGVELPARNIIGSPTGWNPDAHLSWNNILWEGSSNTYNNILINGYRINGNLILDLNQLIHNGETLGGFEVMVSTMDVPNSVPWFAFAYDWKERSATYPGDDYFFDSSNPGFEGVVPEPSTFLLIGFGLAGVGLLRRKLRL